MTAEARRCVESCREWYQVFSNFGKGNERSVKKLLATANMIESLSETAERASAKAALCDSVMEDYDKLRKQLEQVTRERDAAVKCLSGFAPCSECACYKDNGGNCSGKLYCKSHGTGFAWQWKGVEANQ